MDIISTEHSLGGQVTSETDELGNARLYQYDLAGRLTDVYQDATGVTGNVAGQIDAADTHLQRDGKLLYFT